MATVSLLPKDRADLSQIMKVAEAQPARDAKPSLLGMTREELGQALADVGVEDRQIRMRTAQLWHWMCAAPPPSMR